MSEAFPPAAGPVNLVRLADEASPVEIKDLPFNTTDWNSVEVTEHKGVTGSAFWKTQQFGAVRVRMVEYTPGYLADHWCSKGHFILCLDGELHTELKDGRQFTLRPGLSYQVGDDSEPHRSSTQTGARLYIID